MQRGNLKRARENEGWVPTSLRGLVRQDPKTWEPGFINNQRDPPSQKCKILLLYNGFFEKASETWQSTVTKCVSYCTVLQIFVVLSRSLTQPSSSEDTHDEVERQGQSSTFHSRRWWQPAHFSNPIVLFYFIFSLVSPSPIPSRTPNY